MCHRWSASAFDMFAHDLIRSRLWLFETARYWILAPDTFTTLAHFSMSLRR